MSSRFLFLDVYKVDFFQVNASLAVHTGTITAVSGSFVESDLRKFYKQCFCYLNWTGGVNPGDNHIGTLPSGFIPSGSVLSPVICQLTDKDSDLLSRIDNEGKLYIRWLGTGEFYDYFRVQFSYLVA